jgi:hypothetical protein
MKKSKKNRRRKYSSSSSSSDDSSNSSSGSDVRERWHDEYNSKRKHRGAGKKKHKYRKSQRHNPPLQIVKLMEEAVPSDNGIYTGQRERILPAGTIFRARFLARIVSLKHSRWNTWQVLQKMLPSYSNINRHARYSFLPHFSFGHLACLLPTLFGFYCVLFEKYS